MSLSPQLVTGRTYTRREACKAQAAASISLPLSESDGHHEAQEYAARQRREEHDDLVAAEILSRCQRSMRHALKSLPRAPPAPELSTSRRPDARPSRRLLYRRRRAQQDQHAEEYTTQCYWIRSYINKLNYPERNVILRKPCVELLDRSDLSIVRLSNSASSLHAIRA
jgi:hypothetical protein